jgi:hypothetical protein
VSKQGIFILIALIRAKAVEPSGRDRVLDERQRQHYISGERALIDEH